MTNTPYRKISMLLALCYTSFCYGKVCHPVVHKDHKILQNEVYHFESSYTCDLDESSLDYEKILQNHKNDIQTHASKILEQSTQDENEKHTENYLVLEHIDGKLDGKMDVKNLYSMETDRATKFKIVISTKEIIRSSGHMQHTKGMTKSLTIKNNQNNKISVTVVQMIDIQKAGPDFIFVPEVKKGIERGLKETMVAEIKLLQ